MDLITPGLLVISLVIFAQSLFTLYLMLYSWEHPDRLRAAGGPERLCPARLGFTVLLPARHEEAVIGDTIRRVLKANYPAPMVEVIVICSSDDIGTIKVAQRTIETLRTWRARVVTFDGGPINKPHGLNVGFAASRKDVVTIFDAEDDIDPDIFRIINTVMLDEGVGIVQAGVQLVNHRDHWFSLLNCLEYFFWFKSRLHFHARVGMIPLGGNTVFMRRELVARVGGWDEQCLTEDADIGVRLSALGERIRVVYDAKHVTREETPSSIAELVRQRTRWNQGFIQVLRKGDWLQIPGVLRKLVALYTFTFPIIQGPLTLLWPVAVIGGLWLKLPIVIAMATFLPLYAVGFQLLVNMIGAWMFAREFGFAMSPWTPLGLAFTFVPYQFALGLASARAMVRELHGNGSWEKTEHVGAHRRDAPTPRRTWRPLPVFLRLPRRALPLPRTHLLGSVRKAAGSTMPATVPVRPHAFTLGRWSLSASSVSLLKGARRRIANGGLAVVVAPLAAAGASRLLVRVPVPHRPAEVTSPSLGLLARATIDLPPSQQAVQRVVATCDHALAMGPARFCWRCGAALAIRPSSPDAGNAPRMAGTSWPTRRLGGHAAVAAGVVLAVILSVLDR